MIQRGNRLYKDPIIQKVIDVLNEKGPSKLRNRYINGNILIPKQSELPVCYITKDTISKQPADNMEDEHLQNLVATIILDMTNDLNQIYNMVSGDSELYELCEARDYETYELKPDTILSVLSSVQQIDNNFWIGLGSPVEINYGLGIERRGPGIFSVEATIRFTARLHLSVPQ